MRKYIRIGRPGLQNCDESTKVTPLPFSFPLLSFFLISPWPFFQKTAYHFALIQILVDHQLGLQGIAWEDFISRDFFSAPQVVSKEKHEIGGPSHQHERHETTAVPFSITYQRGYPKGTRPLFAAAKRVLSPPGVEGASLPTSEIQVQDKGKKPKHEEGPSGVPPSEWNTRLILLRDDDDTDTRPQNAQLKEIFQEQETEIHSLTLRLEMAKWNIRYLEQRNK